jgi:hypothetical protein
MIIKVIKGVATRVTAANGITAYQNTKLCNDFSRLVAGVGFEPTTFRVKAAFNLSITYNT